MSTCGRWVLNLRIFGSVRMILICRTSVTSAAAVEHLQPELDRVVGASGKWSFDLEDCDRVLRVEADMIAPEEIFDVFHDAGFECEELEDVLVK